MRTVGWAALWLGAAGCTDPMLEEGLAPQGESITTTDCSDCESAPSTAVDGCNEIVGRSFECEGFCHVRDDADPTWDSNPPHSGDHSPVVLRALGQHTEAEPPSRWLENLERGQIVLLYDCPVDAPCDAALDVLRTVMEARADVVLLTPGVDLPPPERFAAVSWTWLHTFDVPDEHELLCFVDQHVDHGRVAMPTGQ